MKLIQKEVSLTDFYHDKAFACLIQLLHRASTWTDTARNDWFLAQRDQLHKVMNVADIKLVEPYWQQLKKVTLGQDSFKVLFERLKLRNLLANQV